MSFGVVHYTKWLTPLNTQIQDTLASQPKIHNLPALYVLHI